MNRRRYSYYAVWKHESETLFVNNAFSQPFGNVKEGASQHGAPPAPLQTVPPPPLERNARSTRRLTEAMMESKFPFDPPLCVPGVDRGGVRQLCKGCSSGVSLNGPREGDARAASGAAGDAFSPHDKRDAYLLVLYTLNIALFWNSHVTISSFDISILHVSIVVSPSSTIAAWFRNTLASHPLWFRAFSWVMTRQTDPTFTRQSQPSTA